MVLCAAVIAGCRPVELAGRSIGQYAVQGTLTVNSCGDGHPAPPTMSFYVELREEPGSASGYWKLPNGPLVGGSLDAAGAFRFEQRMQVVGVPEEPDLGVVGCVLERAEIVRGELVEGPGGGSDGGAAIDGGGALDGGAAIDGGAVVDGGQRPLDAGPPPDPHGILRGETTITVTPVAGGDCSPLLLPLGGAFPALPCELRYVLEGEQLDEPLW